MAKKLKPSDGAATQPARAFAKVQSVTGPYASMVCSDCGALGCLIPVPHKPIVGSILPARDEAA